MKQLEEKIWLAGEYDYKAAYGFEPKINVYLHGDDVVRPCLLIAPGGGYCMVVPIEAHAVAMAFYEKGMNVAVLSYTVDITFAHPLKKQPMKDISRAIRYIRKNAERFGIDAHKLSIMGFSAGGHVCASIATHFGDIEDNGDFAEISNRPDAAILCYPVINSREFTHGPSMDALIGSDKTEAELDYFSCEKNVTPDTPPCFIWQTVEDDLVPVANSMLMAESCRKQGVPYAYYAFPHGPHGLSIGNATLAGEQPDYTCDQLKGVIEATRNGTLVDVTETRAKELYEQFIGPVGQAGADDVGADDTDRDDAGAEQAKEQQKEQQEQMMADMMERFSKHTDVKMWPELCEIWLNSMNLL